MQLVRRCHTNLLLTCMTIVQAAAQYLALCPNPLFECIGSGSGDARLQRSRVETKQNVIVNICYRENKLPIWRWT